MSSLLLAALSMIALAFQSATISAEQRDGDLATEAVVERQIPIFGYIENPEFSDIAKQIGTEYLSHKFVPDEGRDLALAIVTYIGPDVVSNSRFVPPKNIYISPSELEYMTGRFFPEEGCRVERLRFATEGKYIVLLVDASDHPSPEYIEECLLLATLAALGEQMDGTIVQPVPVLYDRIREIVGEAP